MSVIFRIDSDPSSNMNKSAISLQNTSSCLLENYTNVLGSDEADVNNQMSRKCKEENIRSYLKRFSSLVAMMPTLRAGFSLLVYKETPRNEVASSCCFVCDSSVPWNSWTHVIPSLNEKRFRIWKTEMFNSFTIRWKCSHSYSCLPTAVVLKSECYFNLTDSRHLSVFPIYFGLHSGQLVNACWYIFLFLVIQGKTLGGWLLGGGGIFNNRLLFPYCLLEIFVGEKSLMEGDKVVMGGSPTMENPVVCKLFHSQETQNVWKWIFIARRGL